MGLGGDSTAASHHVEGSALSDEDLADGSVDVGAGLDGLQDLAFLDVPLDTMLFVGNVGCVKSSGKFERSLKEKAALGRRSLTGIQAAQRSL